MRDALHANDQELYFRILAQTELLLPVSAQALTGEAAMGWGTWTTGGRTHVLAFTSTAALHACLGATAGPSRPSPYADLAAEWPHHEWWLAVNPGLSIEGYLPAWFVSQLSRGDVRLPGRTMGARARLERADTFARARGDAAPGHESATDAPAGAPSAGGGTPPSSGSPRNPVGASRAPSTVPAPTVPPSTVPPSTVPPSTVPPSTVPSATGAPAIGAGPERRPGAADPTAARIPHPAAPPAPQPSTVDVRGVRPEPTDGGQRPANARVSGTPTGPADLGRPSPLRRRPLGEETSGPANGRSSFFEPASGRGAAARSPRDNPLRAGERATPPARPGLGGQTFPRRRPVRPDDDPTRAFPVDRADDQMTQPIPEPAPPSPGRRPDPLAEEPTRAFRVDVPAAEATQVLPRWHPAPAAPADGEQTQRLPDPAVRPVSPGAPPAPVAEDLSASVAEPVSGPPAPRRGFSPIVIEGTVIESRDLPGPHEPAPAATVFGWRSDGGAATTAARNGTLDAPAPTSPAPGLPAEPAASGFHPEPVVAESAVPGFRAEPVVAEPAGPGFRPEPAAAEPAAADFHSESAVPGFRPEPGTSGAAERPELAVPGVAERPEPVSPAPGAGAGANGTGPGAAGPASSWMPSGDAPTTGVTPDAAGTTTAFPTVQSAATGGTAAEPTSAAGPFAGPAPTVAGAATEPAAEAFQPANQVEQNLLDAAGSGNTDTFLSTLLLARVLLPAAPDSAPGSRPGDPGFVWRTEELDGETYVVVHTSPERLAAHAGEPVETVEVRFVQLIRRWPDETWSFAVNPGTPVGAKLPGEQILGLANWAAEVGLGDDADVEPEPAPAEEPAERTRYAPPATDPSRPVVMQKAVAPSQLAYYLERGYDRVTGFVHRAGELAHLTTPAQLHEALGLGYPDSPFARDAGKIYVLRWPAYRPSLYRIPYGGQNEGAMRAMKGWVIERAPFRGNGFAPGESTDVVAEFKVDSARLPHGAQLWRIGADGTERVIAILDTDVLLWRQVGEP
ncbi:SseB family protein [Micromonospora sp. DT47]|uniref:SseB family protein n=1 Tax=Micromonospora sp. DT47 TaxID=3393431 RepID=UPI003CEE51A2